VPTAILADAQTLTTLVNFDGTNGSYPSGGLVQGTDGKYYGVTSGGGAYFGGTVFRVTPTGDITTLQSFCPNFICGDSEESAPAGSLIEVGEAFYGSASSGGAGAYCNTTYNSGGGCGAIFKITTTGKLTTLYDFCSLPNCADGSNPGSLILASDGNFYGTTSEGGANSASICNSPYRYGCGTIFRISAEGKLTTLYNFCAQANCTDGYLGSAMLGKDGNLYGTTYWGGVGTECASGVTFGCGTVFRVTKQGRLTTLHSFCTEANCPDGNNPAAAPIQGIDGNFYGTTLQGGAYQQGAPIGDGTVFKITAGGQLTTLHSFGESDGEFPDSALIQATDGNIYGTTIAGGGGSGGGTIFKVTPGAVFTSLYTFCSDGDPQCPVGTRPGAPLMQATSGLFYGSNTELGSGGDGTLFSLDVGLRPFVETRPTSGKAETKVIILGNNLTGATSVSFNGKSATFTVTSSTEIVTTVPTGTSTGYVTVRTPKATLKSGVAFTIEP
jgi:uncharacterized repeat protein (TIGR03803 family)